MIPYYKWIHKLYLSQILKELSVMDMKKSVALVAMGVGSTLLYQQVKNGNAKKYLRDIKRFTKKTYDDLEDMMQ